MGAVPSNKSHLNHSSGTPFSVINSAAGKPRTSEKSFLIIPIFMFPKPEPKTFKLKSITILSIQKSIT